MGGGRSHLIAPSDISSHRAIYRRHACLKMNKIKLAVLWLGEVIGAITEKFY